MHQFLCYVEASVTLALQYIVLLTYNKPYGVIHVRAHMMGTKGQQHNHKQIKSIIAIHQPPIGQRKSTQTS